MTTVDTALVEMSGAQLDELFGSSPAGEVPSGRGVGRALVASGSGLALPLAALARLFWRGKVFDASTHSLLNMLTPFAFRAIRADVYTGTSQMDDRPCVVLDYSKSSLVARWIRDEIRQVGPNDYLGLVFVGGRQMPLHFWLTFDRPPA